ncbi:MAG: hypothetical protein ABJA62_06735, partial [Luteimonas sp.]
IMIPVFAGVFVTWFDIMHLFDLDALWFWKNVVGRSLLSVAPGSWLSAADFGHGNFNGPEEVSALFNLHAMYSVLGSAQVWVGALAGILMILAAIRLRRWRDEG